MYSTATKIAVKLEGKKARNSNSVWNNTKKEH